MKRFHLLCALCAITWQLSAVNYCATSSWGYAGTNVTGGGNATPIEVTNESELISALNKSDTVILITQDITVTKHISTSKSNLTIMALPGKKLISTQQDKENSGILYLKGNNLLLRNLTFEGPGAYDCDGWDNLCLDKATNVWVDHCDFQDGCDGNFDIKSTSDNITVSWCRFRYLKPARARECDPREAGCAALTDDHRFSNLIGSGSSDKPADGKYNITYAFCWWDEGCKQRMTRCRNCELHFLNCYWNSSVADYYVGPENASCYFEGCTFAGKANTETGIWNTYSKTTNFCTFVHCTGNLPANSETPVAAPAYTYDQLTAATAKKYVTDSSCGAGATLTVTNSAEVSSSCVSESGEGGEGETPSGDCCINLGLGEEPSTGNDGIPMDFKNILLSTSFNHTSSGWAQGYLNLGSNNDYITFDFSSYNVTIQSATFDVTIPNWAATKNTVSYHWNNGTNTKYEIASNAKENVALTAPANARSFTIQRSASTGTQIAQICFVIKAGTTTAIDEVRPTTNTCKIIREGRLYILRDNTIYDLTGRRVY